MSLTLPFADKWKEVEAGHQIIADIDAGRFRSVPVFQDHGLNIISCPSCSRVENEAFIDLAFKVKQMAAYAKEYDITIAVMGCRVNGPGETDDADIGLWCAPNFVNLKRGEQEFGAYPYDIVLDRLRVELDAIIEQKKLAKFQRLRFLKRSARRSVRRCRHIADGEGDAKQLGLCATSPPTR